MSSPYLAVHVQEHTVTRRFATTAIALTAAVLAAACGGGGTEGAGRPAPAPGESRSIDGRGETAPPSARTVAPPPSPSSDGSRSVGGPGETASPSPSGGGPADGAPWDASRKSERNRGVDATELSVLTGVRVGVHDTYDRVVFDFEGGAPGYVAEYVDALHQDGSGMEVPVAGEHRIMLVFLRAQPEEELGGEGQATPTVRGLKLVSYFEGDTRFGVGVDARRGDGRPGFRVTTAPNRIVLDIAHEAADSAG